LQGLQRVEIAEIQNQESRMNANVALVKKSTRAQQDDHGSILLYPSLGYINPFNPSQEDIDIRDIAHALALTSRYGGHSPEPFSVAEHSWRVSCTMATRPYYDEPSILLAGLLHDAEEAYFCDMPSPIKRHPAMERYKFAAEDMRRAIFAKFSLEASLISHTKWADDAEYYRERRAMWPDDSKDYVKPWGWQQAELWFLNRFEILQAERAAKVAT
jgi:hypothetical protein